MTLHLSSELMERLDRFLWSSASNKVPFGAYSRFFEERIEEFFARSAVEGNDLLKEMTDVQP